MLQGLRTTIYAVPDLARAKQWYSETFGIQPYFDEPFYVGFNVGGYELGLDPDTSKAGKGPGSVVTYWGVEDVERELASLVKRGVKVRTPVTNVGGPIKVAEIEDPFGNVIGLIENPEFKLPPSK